MTNRTRNGFTLLELLVVIAIIAVLLGLVFPVFQGVQERAKKVQAKNDLTQIVTAVNAFYTEYGRYPTTATSDVTLGSGGAKTDTLFTELHGGGTINTRQIQFISPPEDKTQTTAKGKIGGDGQFYDPWGSPYNIAIDANYNNVVAAPAYSDLQASYTTDSDTGVRTGVIAWSLGKDNTLGTKNGSSNFKGSDDVISWQ